MNPRPLPRLASLSSWLLMLLPLAGCSSFLGHAERPRRVVRGPIPSRPNQPLALTVLSFRPRRAAVQAKGEWGLRGMLAYSSIEEIGQDGANRAEFDGELLRATFAARYGFGRGAEFAFEVPFLFAHAGFLDTFVEAWHSTFGLPDGGRDLVPDDRYGMELVAGGESVYELQEERFGVQDVPLILTQSVLEEGEGRPGVALRLGVELPTGSESAGYGNGAFDFGVAWIAEKSFGRWTLTGGVDFVRPGQPDSFEASDAVQLTDVLGWEFGLEYRWSDAVSLLLGTEWTSRRVSSLDLEEIDREIFDFGLGLAWDVGPRSWMSLSFFDDLVSATGPDFTLFLTFQTGF